MGFLVGALKLLPVIIGAVKTVERLVTDRKGVEKQNAAVEIVQEFLPVVEETITGKDLLNEHQDRTIRLVIDAVVALMNLHRDLARARAASSTSAAGGS